MKKLIYLLSALFMLGVAMPAMASSSPVGYSTGIFAGDFVKEKETERYWYIHAENGRRMQVSESDPELMRHLLDFSLTKTWPQILAVPDTSSDVTVAARLRSGIKGLVHDDLYPDVLWHVQKKAYKRAKLNSREAVLEYIKNSIPVTSKDIYEYPIAFADYDFTVPDPKDAVFPEQALASVATSSKHIVVSLKEQRLRAYENGKLVNTFLISSGKGSRFGTKPGLHSVLAKKPVVRYAWTYAIGSPDNYDLGNVPYNLSIYPHTYIHYAYWHNNFGRVMSHGCVNVNLANMKWIYRWADQGTPVLIN